MYIIYIYGLNRFPSWYLNSETISWLLKKYPGTQDHYLNLCYQLFVYRFYHLCVPVRDRAELLFEMGHYFFHTNSTGQIGRIASIHYGTRFPCQNIIILYTLFTRVVYMCHYYYYYVFFSAFIRRLKRDNDIQYGQVSRRASIYAYYSWYYYTGGYIIERIEKKSMIHPYYTFARQFVNVLLL